MLCLAASEDLNAELAQANRLLQAQEYDGAYAEYSKYAHDNPLAQFSLGLIEQYGWGRPANPAAACRWFDGASKGNIPMAQQMLADCYRLGTHAPASFSKAQQWYRKAAENGLATANYWWGRMLIEGQPGEKNLRKGVRLCEQAAQAGALEAQLYLANSYRSGELLGEDRQRALYWYNLAAQSNNPEALYSLGMFMRNDVLEDFSRDTTLLTLEKAAAQGYQPAYLPTAALYFDAPLDRNTKMPAATNLAKSYLWLQAVLLTSEQPEERAQAEKMLTAVIQVMPQSWLEDLDSEVEEHFARVNDSGVNR